MEDGDGESTVMDTWISSDEQQHKDMSNDDTLNHINDSNVFSDGTEENKEERLNSVGIEEATSRNTCSTSKIVFKGYKKRILAQTQENQTSPTKICLEGQLPHSNTTVKNNKEKKPEAKRGKITEYAQYLGLQPAPKYKCLKCHSSASFCSMSMLKQHQRICSPTMAPMQGVLGSSESSSRALSSNFRITRKVYLCSACGTYFENWNLFLHMRDVHKRHICLFCLGMFGQAERLSYHLSSKHSVPEMTFTSVEDFYNAFKGSCYLICCNCEKVFSETDNFYNHFCPTPQKQQQQQSSASVCSLCRQTGSHLATCSLATEKNKIVNTSLQSPSSPHSSASATMASSQLTTPSSKGISKKMMKNNRIKSSDDSVPGSCHRKTPESYTKMANAKAHSTPKSISDDAVATTANSVTSPDSGEDLDDSLRDTVAETIMEVSKYVGDSADGIETDDKDDSMSIEESPEVDSPVRLVSSASTDSVTQTIMEVSLYVNNIEGVKCKENEVALVNDSKNGNDVPVDSIEDKVANISKPEDEEADVRLNSPSPKAEAEEEKRDEDLSMPNESRTDSDSQASNSPVRSPAGRSLFSPHHEHQVTDNQEKEQSTEVTSIEENTDAKEPENATKPESSVSFNTVTTSDRSLVIKICTNRSSQFSVSTTESNVNNSESHDTSRESEENNNGEGSASEEKTSNLSEKEHDSHSSYQVNDGDSDSDTDSETLAVVDSNVKKYKNSVDAEDNIEDKSEAITEVGIETGEDTDIQKVEGDSHQNEKDTNSIIFNKTNTAVPEEKQAEPDGIVLAGEDVPSIDLNVEGLLDSIEIEELLKACISAASPTCVYCNHARQIAVNGKRLGLHMLAEHRFQPQHPAIIIHREQFISRVKKSLPELETNYFNLDSYTSSSGTYNVPQTRIYECFHCRFHSAVHKELYLHNRKMHQKTILICIMCKSTFYSYSELLCHLCPGVYCPNINIRYRCCLCPVGSLPSAFRLMVHLRKRHHVCDVCLESTGNQQRLSNHVWKHKLHHLCYRCGIAYRNKPDITKHLFWKHGTESVLCKKCLQKKWPHVYHFCIPPTAFVCEECSSIFSRAVALKVHKRLHSGDLPYSCTDCAERFISKKLLRKHENEHKEPLPEDVNVTDATSHPASSEEQKQDSEKVLPSVNAAEPMNGIMEAKENVKKVVDIYDLPPLNLSSESDSDSDEEKVEGGKDRDGVSKDNKSELLAKETPQAPIVESVSTVEPNDSIVEVERNEEEKQQEAQIMDGIWDNFKSYAASLEQQESVGKLVKEPQEDIEFLRKVVLAEHDYCLSEQEKLEKQLALGEEALSKDESTALGAEHDYTSKAPKSPTAVQNESCENETSKKKVKTPRKKKQNGSTSSSDSSSDSDSSSCSCGTNCSCSSSSSGCSSSSSSSSDSDSSASDGSPKKQSNRKERRKEKETARKNKSDSVEPEVKEPSVQVENGNASVEDNNTMSPPKIQLRESDLETDETETDEDFYDEHPQQLANKLLAEKRNQLMLLAAVAPASTESSLSAPMNNGIGDNEPTTHSPEPMTTTAEEVPQPKKKVKTKKRKKSEKGKQRNLTPTVESIKLNIPKSFYQSKTGFASSSPAMITVVRSRSSTPNVTNSPNEMNPTTFGTESQPVKINQNFGSGSETENKRSSKRKRIPKRFYGDSSDEEGEKQQPPLKWRKVMPASTFVPTPVVKSLPPPPPPPPPVPVPAPISPSPSIPVAASASESEEPAESSSDSSDSEEPDVSESPAAPPAHLPGTTNAPAPERSDNLYCYCQCPYDEVSEMIACDGEDCRIEWFHFECVGIMVPPKGKWYCPDCRKKHGILQNEDYFD
ncbi:uncharacterized protein LOC107273258 [Cephus cinctus]|uniref:Uncharacterized protein LOC107273258 n=1 Tax=Cephus cinctus TaxID=211228 RepID=A0AAJ7W759_CEPCN|nr:uncharacterized protein LOC107273258 [Cephus cinctus]XP_024946342.1 uncharacterized protein LOC107273258 [Cephus cinctus]